MRASNHAKRMCLVVLITFATVLPWRGADAECGDSTNRIAGAVVGAVVGGLLGSAFGSGDGKRVAIGVGAVAGGFIGHQFGARMDCDDRLHHQRAAQHSLETQPTGTTSTWRNPDSGHEGSFTPVNTYQTAGGEYCRDFVQSVTVDGYTERDDATACRGHDAKWRVVQVDALN